jgi:hypothetical protein
MSPIRNACASYRITQALQLVRTLAGIIELDTPLLPRRPPSRDQTLVTSLRVVRKELEKALADLDLDDQGVRRTA